MSNRLQELFEAAEELAEEPWQKLQVQISKEIARSVAQRPGDVLQTAALFELG